MKTRVLDSITEINANQWDNLVSQTDGGCIFHKTGWLRAIEDGTDVEAKHVVVQKKENPIAVCPNFVVDVPVPSGLPPVIDRFVPQRLHSVTPGFGGPLIISNEDTALDLLFEAIGDVCGAGLVSHRMRVLDPALVRYAQPFVQRGYRPSLTNCRFLFDLGDGIEAIWESMDKERRKDIRDVKEHDPQIERTHLREEDVDDFYREYEKTMDRVGGVQYPRDFFRALADHLGDDVLVFTATVDGAVIGKHLCLVDETQDSVHYFFNGTDEQYFKYSPSPLLHDHTVRWAVDNGYDTYDFGSSNANYRNGVFTFKSKFGAEIEPVYSWEKGYAPVRWRVYRGVRGLYRRYTSVLDE